MRRRRRLEIGLAVLVCASAWGCGKTPEPLHPVSGVVTVGGKPLGGGSIQFEMIEQGAASGKVFTASGEIQEDGSYSLVTFAQAGAPAGEHRVWVTPNFAAMPDQLGVDNRRASPIPRDYMMPTTTELRFTVEEGDNVIDVEIPSKRRG